MHGELSTGMYMYPYPNKEYNEYRRMEKVGPRRHLRKVVGDLMWITDHLR